ncbi:F11 receptor, tandem duplicate 1 isoform X1 [Scleropages formosus]|uniref:Junctional adhesion molecule A n=1 Tax=Scleropages formosus TaxID=113540 RepID=A0A8C9W735_SCLFO|nr:junctional adhesion molecule A-like isoform X1 [Scleropages formosus]
MFVAILVFLLLLQQQEGSLAFSVTTSTPKISVPENQGADLKCSYSADFGTPRVEWKFRNLQGSETYVVFTGNPTGSYKDRVELYSGGLRFIKVTRADTGEYSCDVSNADKFGEAKIQLIVQVPPSPPLCGIPSTVTTGSQVILTCNDKDGSPPSTYKWFKNKTPLPEDPSKFAIYKNSTYTINPQDGNLLFASVAKEDSGEYYCTASNGFGSPASCAPMLMEVKDVNVGGIVAGVIVALLAVALLIFGLWYARRKGYLSKNVNESKQMPQYTRAGNISEEADGEFKQKSSFIV